METENTLESLYLSEAILGTLEGLLSTSLDSNLLPYREELEISVKPSGIVGVIPHYEVKQEGGNRRVEILHTPLIHLGSKEEQQAFGRWLMEIILVIVAEIALTDNFEKHFDKLAKEEAGFERALNFSLPSIFVKNLHGDKPKLDIFSWQSGVQTKGFPLQREFPWTHVLPVAPEQEIQPLINSKPGEGEPPEALFGVDNLKHRDRKVLSVIDNPLWNRAGWKAVLYGCFPHADAPPPIMALGF